jgi:undecaprenyl-diphosphatase
LTLAKRRMISWLNILILGLVQGAAELLPVSSSAHVIVTEKLMGIDPAGPQAMFILAMLHTGTMFSVIVYFWAAWKETFFSSMQKFYTMAWRAAVATVITGAVGFGPILVIEKVFLKNTHTGDIEELSSNLFLIGAAMAVAGIWIIVAGVRRADRSEGGGLPISMRVAAWMGFAQGLCLPFRGLSRSGATISTALLAHANRRRAEEFSFALAVIITPAVIVRETLRLRKAYPEAIQNGTIHHLVMPGLLGLVASFLSGLLALRLLSSWLENGQWRYFGYYCMAAAVVVFGLHAAGY